MAVIAMCAPNDTAFRGSLYTDNTTGDFVFNYHVAVRDTTAAKSYSIDVTATVAANTATLALMLSSITSQVVTAVGNIGVTVPSNRVFIPAIQQGS